ncbi:MAG: hypothetical protein RIS70_3721 [Planctomycetota bacterium]
MCILAIQYKLVPEAPILVAMNREERYDRPTAVPSIQSGKPRILCGIDQQAGGTWLGVNQHGLLVAACNRPRHLMGVPTRSRGLLCRDMLRAGSARQAMDLAMEELSTNKYDGVNLVCADAESGWVVHGGDELEVSNLEEGLSIVCSGDVNDPRNERSKLARRLLTLQTLDSPVKFLAVASKVFARPASAPDRPGMIVAGNDRGTVSSTLIALGKKPRDAIFQYAPSSPDKSKYEDYSPLLRDILSRGLRESRTKAKA